MGESGCGKSTLVRLVTRMLDPTAGDIIFDGRNIGYIPARLFPHSPIRSKIQMVFQDPSDSLNPRHTAFDTIAEPLQRLARVTDRDELAHRVMDAAEKVGLPQELLPRYPHQLSGGQKARVGIARAVAMSPALLVLDEPTAALDVSVQATILKLLADLKRQLGDELSLRVARSQRGAHAVRPRDRHVPGPHRRAGPHRGVVPHSRRILIPRRS